METPTVVQLPVSSRAFNQNPNLCACRLLGLQHTNLIVGQVNIAEYWVKALQDTTQGVIESVNRSVSLGGGDFCSVAHTDFNNSGGAELFMAWLVYYGLEVV